MTRTGLIQNSDQNVIDLVKSLVVSHIESENTLILITIPMSGEKMHHFWLTVLLLIPT